MIVFPALWWPSVPRVHCFLASLLATSCLVSCAAPESDAKSAYTVRETKIESQGCEISPETETMDADGDGQPEIYVRRRDGREICRCVDLDFDGQIDRTTYFDAGGNTTRVESDFDRDGLLDEIAVFLGGELREKHRATTLRGKLDTWDFYEGGTLVRSERDQNGDGVIDQWWDYANPSCPVVFVDVDADGRPDPVSSVDYCQATGRTLRSGDAASDPGAPPSPASDPGTPPSPGMPEGT